MQCVQLYQPQRKNIKLYGSSEIWSMSLCMQDGRLLCGLIRFIWNCVVTWGNNQLERFGKLFIVRLLNLHLIYFCYVSAFYRSFLIILQYNFFILLFSEYGDFKNLSSFILKRPSLFDEPYMYGGRNTKVKSSNSIWFCVSYRVKIWDPCEK